MAHVWPSEKILVNGIGARVREVNMYSHTHTGAPIVKRPCHVLEHTHTHGSYHVVAHTHGGEFPAALLPLSHMRVKPALHCVAVKGRCVYGGTCDTHYSRLIIAVFQQGGVTSEKVIIYHCV